MIIVIILIIVIYMITIMIISLLNRGFHGRSTDDAEIYPYRYNHTYKSCHFDRSKLNQSLLDNYGSGAEKSALNTTLGRDNNMK